MPVVQVPNVAPNSDPAIAAAALMGPPTIAVKGTREEHSDTVDEGNFIRFDPPHPFSVNTTEGVVVVVCKKDPAAAPGITPFGAMPPDPPEVMIPPQLHRPNKPHKGYDIGDKLEGAGFTVEKYEWEYREGPDSSHNDFLRLEPCKVGERCPLDTPLTVVMATPFKGQSGFKRGWRSVSS